MTTNVMEVEQHHVMADYTSGEYSDGHGQAWLESWGLLIHCARP